MASRSRSDEELALFPLDVHWRDASGPHDGTIVAADGDLRLDSAATWPIRQIPGIVPSPIELRGTSERGLFVLSGYPEVRNGAHRIGIQDLRVGNDDPDALLIDVTPHFDYATEAVSTYIRDGAARSPSVPLNVPALDGAPAMTLTYDPNLAGRPIELSFSGGTSINQYEIQLDSLQRLMTFATQEPVARRLLTARDRHGTNIEIYRRLTPAPGRVRSVDVRDFPIRLIRRDTQTVVERWWAMMNDLRPIPHLLAALRWEPGYLESDFLLLATALDRLSDAWTSEDGLLTAFQFADLKAAARALGIPAAYYIGNDPSFQSRVAALVATLSDEAWANLRVDRDSWLTSLKRHRNLVAHSSAQRKPHREFLTGRGLPALRRTTDAILTLIVAKHLGLDEAALAFAAERLYVNELSPYAGNLLTFTSNGIEDRLT